METVATLATPEGTGGIGTILVAGSGARSLLGRVFRPREGAALDEPTPGRLYLGSIRAENRPLDEVLVSFPPVGFPVPNPTEVAIHAHGGPVTLAAILEALEENGVRVVTPEEYLRIAWPSDLSDATRAEALAILPRCPTLLGARTLLSQWAGSLSAEIRRLEGVARSAASSRETAGRSGDALRHGLEDLLATASSGMGLHRPSRVVLAGNPNAGKSSLFNALLQVDRVIISDRPGTTRDTIDAWIEMDGYPVEIVDTPGIAAFDDVVRTRGVDRARAAIGSGDLVVLLVDGSRAVTREDQALAAEVASRDALVLVSKSDLPRVTAMEDLGIDSGVAGAVSAKTGEGLDRLQAGVLARLRLDPTLDPNGAVLFTERQAGLVIRAFDAAVRPGGAEEAGEILASVVEESHVDEARD